MGREIGRRQLERLYEDTNPGLAVAILEAQEALGTAIAKRKGVVLMAAPTTAVNMLQVGYKVKFKTKTSEGTDLAVGTSCLEHLNHQVAHKDDVVTGWRPWKSVLKSFYNRDLRLRDIPRFIRCRNCVLKCQKEECPYEPVSVLPKLMLALALVNWNTHFDRLHLGLHMFDVKH